MGADVQYALCVRGGIIALEQERATLAELNSSLSNLNISLDRLRERNQNLDSETNKVKQEVNITQAGQYHFGSSSSFADSNKV